jgi:phosphoribosylformylglycinamidine synthase
MRVRHNGEVVCDVPVKALTDEAPVYERAMRAQVPSSESGVRSPAGLSSQIEVSGSPNPETADSELQTPNYNDTVLKLLASPNLASKEWVYRQYDHMVRTNTAVLPGADAAVVRIKETRRALAVSLDGNGRYCAIDPRAGAKLIVAEAARNVVCVGAQPIAITNCLNFASPERPEVMWAFSEVIDGIAEACQAFNTPVVSGNVSFYNETEGRGIVPTPVIGMLGLVDDIRRVIQPGFKNPGDFIVLLGATRDDLAASEYLSVTQGRVGDRVPELDLAAELAVQTACLSAAQKGLLRSAHDCADGGLAVALAECCFSSLNREGVGADIDLTGEYDITTRLFSESPSRIIISFDQSLLGDIEEVVAAAGCPMTLLGNVGSDRLRIESDGEEIIQLEIAEMETAWRSSLAQKLQAEAMAAGAE